LNTYRYRLLEYTLLVWVGSATGKVRYPSYRDTEDKRKENNEKDDDGGD